MKDNVIIPCLWYDHQAEEAAKFYTSVFKGGKMEAIAHYSEGGMMPAGMVMTVKFQLAGKSFVALNGGPYFTFTPATSFFVGCQTVQELDVLWDALVDGGAVLMERDALLPFFEKFGWLQDKYGLSWQLGVCGVQQYITPYFLFVGQQHGKAEEAINFYCSVFADSTVESMVRYGKDMGETEGTVQHASFSLSGQPFMATESGFDHQFAFSEAVSFYIYCKTQEEIDYYWSALSADGSGQCGWLKDKFGISWQVVPENIEQLMTGDNIERTKRVMDALSRMSKLDIAALQKAYDN